MSIPIPLDSVVGAFLELLERAKPRLFNNSDEAAKQLRVVLSEVAKSYQALADVLVRMAALRLDNEQDIQDAREFLLRVQGGQFNAEFGETRAHCYTITNICKRYLRGWFSRVLNKEEAAELEVLFGKFSEFDEEFVLAMDRVTSEAQKAAIEILQLINSSKLGEARTAVKVFAQGLSEPSIQLAKRMAELWGLQADFVQLSGAV